MSTAKWQNIAGSKNFFSTLVVFSAGGRKQNKVFISIILGLITFEDLKGDPTLEFARSYKWILFFKCFI